MKLEEAIRQAVKNFGKGIIAKGTFVNVLSDYCAFSDVPAAKQVIRTIVETGYGEKIVSLSIDAQGQNRMMSYSTEIVRLYGFNEYLVSSIIRMLVASDIEIGEKLDLFLIEKKDGKYGCVGVNKETLIPFDYWKMRLYQSDYGNFIIGMKDYSMGGNYDIFTVTGDLLFSVDGSLRLTNDRNLFIAKNKGKCGCILPNGTVVIPFIYENIVTMNPQSSCRLFVVELKEGNGVIDYNNRTIIPPVFQTISNNMDEKYDLIEVKTTERFCFLHSNGNVAVIPDAYFVNDIHSYSSKTKGKMGGFYTDDGQKIVITSTNAVTKPTGDIILESLDDFHEGLAVAEDKYERGFVNYNLEFIIKDWKRDPQKFDRVYPFYKGLAVAELGISQGMIDRKGEIVHQIHDDIIRRDWCHIVRHDLFEWRDDNGQRPENGTAYIWAYGGDLKYNGGSLRLFNTLFFDVSNQNNNRIFARLWTFYGVFTTEGYTIEPMEYERILSYDYEHDLDKVSPKRVRRNGIWGELSLEKGFTEYSKNKSEDLECQYINWRKQEGKFIPYCLPHKLSEPYSYDDFTHIKQIPTYLYDEFLNMVTHSTELVINAWLKEHKIEHIKYYL